MIVLVAVELRRIVLALLAATDESPLAAGAINCPKTGPAQDFSALSHDSLSPSDGPCKLSERLGDGPFRFLKR